MGFFKWLYRLPGRIDRSLGPTVAATDGLRGTGMGGIGANPAGVNIVAEEIRESIGSNKGHDQADDPKSGLVS